MERRSAEWKKIYLSRGGHLNLIKRLGSEPKLHLVNWKIIYSPVPIGVLGIKNRMSFNKALLGKWLWRFLQEESSLWGQPDK